MRAPTWLGEQRLVVSEEWPIIRGVKANLTLKLDTAHLKPGMRLAVGVSGGADSVALLRALHARAGELGLVLTVAHLHHGLRGAEAAADLEFVRELAGRLGLPFREARVDTAAEAARLPGKPAETIEEAARRVRYAWFRELMGEPCRSFESVPGKSASGSARAKGGSMESGKGFVDAVATAHTLDDQAETVLAKFLRGAWTEGLSGIHPVLRFPGGKIVRPLLRVTRAEVEAYLEGLGQEWREDSTNRHLTFTRNRIRHELLPLLESWNPRLKEHLAQMAELARDEEAWWEDEAGRVAAEVILTGKPVRGGGRAASEGVALDVARLRGMHPALQRRIVRRAADGLGAAMDFAGTEAVRELALGGKAGQKCESAGGVRGERTHRELRLSSVPAGYRGDAEEAAPPEIAIPIPGDGESAEYGLHVRVEITAASPAGNGEALLRCWKPGDRVRLQHSAAPKKVKEVLERLKVSGSARARWPVLEIRGRIVWMRGVVVEPEPGLTIKVWEPKGTAGMESA